ALGRAGVPVPADVDRRVPRARAVRGADARRGHDRRARDAADLRGLSPLHRARPGGAAVRAEAQALRTEEEPRAPRVSLEPARAFVRSTLVEAPRDGVLAITVAAPVAPVEAPLRALRKGPSWVLAPSEGIA